MSTSRAGNPLNFGARPKNKVDTHYFANFSGARCVFLLDFPFPVLKSNLLFILNQVYQNRTSKAKGIFEKTKDIFAFLPRSSFLFYFSNIKGTRQDAFDIFSC